MTDNEYMWHDCTLLAGVLVLASMTSFRSVDASASRRWRGSLGRVAQRSPGSFRRGNNNEAEHPTVLTTKNNR